MVYFKIFYNQIVSAGICISLILSLFLLNRLEKKIKILILFLLINKICAISSFRLFFCFFLQATESIQVPFRFAGAVTVTNKGISTVLWMIKTDFISTQQSLWQERIFLLLSPH